MKRFTASDTGLHGPARADFGLGTLLAFDDDTRACNPVCNRRHVWAAAALNAGEWSSRLPLRLIGQLTNPLKPPMLVFMGALWPVFFRIPVGRAAGSQRHTSRQYEEASESSGRESLCQPYAIKTTEALRFRRLASQRQ